MKRFAIAILVLLMMPLVSLAQWRDGSGKVVPDTPSSKSDGEFGAMLDFTDKPEELYAAWEKDSPGVAWSQTSTAVRGKPIVAIVFFSGCAANPAGKCELLGRFTTTTPSGKLWGDPIEAEIWVGLPPPEPQSLQLSHGHMGLVVDPDDELGKYSVKLELTDQISKKRMVLEKHFTAVEAPKEQQR
jgi:hypothetical protein